MANVAIVGASGLVGRKLTEILTDKMPYNKYRLFGNTSVGEKMFHFCKTYTVEPLEELLKWDVDYAMFMANESVAKEIVPRLSAKGAVCIDNSSAFRLEKGVPLVVPQINGHTVGCSKIIANPNCTTIQVAIALHALKDLGIKAITVATYQAVSGAGKDGLSDLVEQNGYGKLKCFTHPIYDNILPQIGEITPEGATTEELKLRNESRKILEMPTLSVNSFCVRVPVTVGHGAFVNVKFDSKFDLEEVNKLLKAEKDVLVFDGGMLPMPSVARHTHFVGVGRLHKDGDGGLNMFVVADNLLRGAAYNAYQILQMSMRNNGDLPNCGGAKCN